MRDINTLYPNYMSRPWIEEVSDGIKEQRNGSGEIAVSRRICESIKGLHKAITNHEHVKNSAQIAVNLVNKLKDPSGVRVSNPPTGWWEWAMEDLDHLGVQLLIQDKDFQLLESRNRKLSIYSNVEQVLETLFQFKISLDDTPDDSWVPWVVSTDTFKVDIIWSTYSCLQIINLFCTGQFSELFWLNKMKYRFMNVLLSLKVTLGSWSRLDLIHDLIITVVNFDPDRSGSDLILS